MARLESSGISVLVTDGGLTTDASNNIALVESLAALGKEAFASATFYFSYFHSHRGKRSYRDARKAVMMAAKATPAGTFQRHILCSYSPKPSTSWFSVGEAARHGTSECNISARISLLYSPLIVAARMCLPLVK